MSARRLVFVALVLLVIASPCGYAVAQIIGTAATGGATAYFQSLFLGGDIGTLVVWLAIIAIGWGMWHMTHNIWASMIPAIFFLVLYYRSPVIGPAIMAALASGTAGAP